MSKSRVKSFERFGQQQAAQPRYTPPTDEQLVNYIAALIGPSAWNPRAKAQIAAELAREPWLKRRWLQQHKRTQEAAWEA